ncbi:MAG: hypothetical protein IPG22_07110 [Acidobacteria bacterium]|nr:hypothetical protein [Acidobacteriota bacterium]
MTRSHEEVTIRNIFLSKFLERLREIERETVQLSSSPIPPSIPAAVETTVPTNSAIFTEPQTHIQTESTVEAKDEFLGIVDSEESVQERPSYANECKPECEEEIVSMLDSAEAFSNVEPPDEARVEHNSVPPPILNLEVEESQEHDAVKSASEVESDPEPTRSIESLDDSVSDRNDTEQSVRSVVLSEKEPYNFDACTITVVIQLLPESNGSRDSVVSVRSHGFAPQIAFVNRCNESGEFNLSDPISAALDEYQKLPSSPGGREDEEGAGYNQKAKSQDCCEKSRSPFREGGYGRRRNFNFKCNTAGTSEGPTVPLRFRENYGKRNQNYSGGKSVGHHERRRNGIDGKHGW